MIENNEQLLKYTYSKKLFKRYINM